ncbi:hypothetical protein Pelo_13032 [Pelomyxa schiedti]|nr:hypothetical protein Pelo_13032 [Pelomyxa schiedti]
MPGEDKSPPMDTPRTTQSSSAAVNGGSAPAIVYMATAKVLSHDIISDGEAWKARRKMLGLPEVVQPGVKEKMDNSMVKGISYRQVLVESGISAQTGIRLVGSYHDRSYCDCPIWGCSVILRTADHAIEFFERCANESIEGYTRRMRYTYEQVYGSVYDVNTMRNLIETMISRLLPELRAKSMLYLTLVTGPRWSQSKYPLRLVLIHIRTGSSNTRITWSCSIGSRSRSITASLLASQKRFGRGQRLRASDRQLKTRIDLLAFVTPLLCITFHLPLTLLPIRTPHLNQINFGFGTRNGIPDTFQFLISIHLAILIALTGSDTNESVRIKARCYTVIKAKVRDISPGDEVCIEQQKGHKAVMCATVLAKIDDKGEVPLLITNPRRQQCRLNINALNLVDPIPTYTIDQNRVKQLLEEYLDIISDGDIDTGDTAPIALPMYRKVLEINRIIEEEVKKVVLVEKPIDFVDYKRLNAVTKKMVYQMPRFDDMLDVLGGNNWFTGLDLKAGYWQVEISFSIVDKPTELYRTLTGLPEGIHPVIHIDRPKPYLDSELRVKAAEEEQSYEIPQEPVMKQERITYISKGLSIKNSTWMTKEEVDAKVMEVYEKKEVYKKAKQAWWVTA